MRGVPTDLLSSIRHSKEKSLNDEHNTGCDQLSIFKGHSKYSAIRTLHRCKRELEGTRNYLDQDEN